MNVISTPLLSRTAAHATRSTTRIVRLIDRVNVFDAFQSAAWLIIPRASLSSSLSFSLETHATKSRLAEIFRPARRLSFFEITARPKKVVHFRGESLDWRKKKSAVRALLFPFRFHAISFYPLINNPRNSIERRYPLFEARAREE